MKSKANSKSFCLRFYFSLRRLLLVPFRLHLLCYVLLCSLLVQSNVLRHYYNKKAFGEQQKSVGDRFKEQAAAAAAATKNEWKNKKKFFLFYSIRKSTKKSWEVFVGRKTTVPVPHIPKHNAIITAYSFNLSQCYKWKTNCHRTGNILCFRPKMARY